ncbi:MAG: AbrB family transcriptional regulator [Thermosynechococcus sp. Uc]|uniref:AbrB family transcriptional regulator n=1 Tax=Thermosynechococcus sp. Uc TaxID=3034853 RepID=UPI001A06C436|nr:AbrB family transcriptional regulator [Thermosynechococcus sp. Uc]MDM7325525.1 AbrB family transcriptional regulator [Thermosynechococcus sp. Uc]HIK25545.1 AbrB family transcriptional regulator [Thermosynechococcus sp. M46_R2017_013]
MGRKQVEPLTGAALLEKYKQLGHLSHEEKAKACGYYTVTQSGKERISKLKFNKALLEALGMKIDSKPKRGGSRGGRSASYRITVQANGNLLIGSAYTKQMNLKPGDEFEITLGRKHIHLKQVSSNGHSIDDEN